MQSGGLEAPFPPRICGPSVSLAGPETLIPTNLPLVSLGGFPLSSLAARFEEEGKGELVTDPHYGTTA